MGHLESGRMARECHFLLAVLCAMVRHGEAEAGGGADRVLVVKSGGLVVVAQLRSFLRERFRFHLRLCLHLDPLYTEFDHSAAA